MKTRVSRWGNSLAVRIPKQSASKMHLRDGAYVQLQEISGSLLLTPSSKKEATLDELLDAITPENCHPEIAAGEPVGGEVW